MKDEWEEGSNEWDENELEDKEEKPATSEKAELVTMKHTEDQDIVTDHQVERDMHKYMNQVKNTLQIDADKSFTLLTCNSWNQSNFENEQFENQEKLFVKVGLTNSKIVPNLFTDRCPICFDIINDDSQYYNLKCGHRVCKSCMREQLKDKLRTSALDCINSRCPANPDCFCKVTYSEWESNLQPDEFQKYLYFIKKNQIDTKKDYMYCPKDCGLVCKVHNYQDARTNKLAISCHCHQNYCFLCACENHLPADCKTSKEWMLKHNSESENVNWIIINTKQCPVCNKNIEKNQGCNHMTCNKASMGCGHEFCWICLKDWKGHQDYQSCNKQQQEKDDKMDGLKKNHNKYMHQVYRQDNHDKSMRFAQESRSKLEEKVSELSDLSVGLEQLQFMQKAIDVVVECRRMLKWSQCLGYYQEETSLYEYLQENIEKNLEELSEMTELGLDDAIKDGIGSEEFVKYKNNVISKSSMCEKQQKNFIEGCSSSDLVKK